MKTITINISDIAWDTSDFTEEEELVSGICVPDLPNKIDNLELEVFDMNNVLDDIKTYLEFEYGHCVNGLAYEIVSDED